MSNDGHTNLFLYFLGKSTFAIIGTKQKPEDRFKSTASSTMISVIATNSSDGLFVHMFGNDSKLTMKLYLITFM